MPAKKPALDALPQVYAQDRAALRRWLEQHHATSGGIWLVTDKKSSAGDAHLDYDAIVEEALCFGWVDSLPRALDDRRTMLLLTPRKPRSNWSALNKRRVAKLLDAGLMAPAGLAMVELARQSGTWDALDDVDALRLPDDLARALDELPPARDHFDAFPKSVRRGILEWIFNAKRPETRRKRILETARLAQQNLRANQWRP